jgi:hypothetical protein
MNTPLPTHHDGLHGADTGFATTLGGLGHQASDLALDGARSVRERAVQVRDTTAGFVQHKPFSALLMAAAGGAAILWLAGWLMRSSGARH